LNRYCLRKKIITHVKDEGFNLNAMINAIKSIIVCSEILGFKESFQGYCFGHVFSKAYQYVTTKNKICKNLKEMSITST
jgi:hypothetical protein